MDALGAGCYMHSGFRLRDVLMSMWVAGLTELHHKFLCYLTFDCYVVWSFCFYGVKPLMSTFLGWAYVCCVDLLIGSVCEFVFLGCAFGFICRLTWLTFVGLV